MSNIRNLTDEQYEVALHPLWQYLGVFDPPAPAEVIFVFGGLDLAVPRHAAELFSRGFAPTVLISGASGPLTRSIFVTTEAETFRDEMMKYGTPTNVILLELRATNALENVRLGMTTLSDHGVRIRSALLVAKTFLMRRCKATFQKQYPDVATRCCPPNMPVRNAVDRERSEFAKRLLAELRRLDEYAVKGDIAPQLRDEAVEDAAAHLGALIAQED